MNKEKNVNRNYKDSVFSTLFSDKKRLIGLYNAIEGKNYPEETEIEINTLDDVIYMDRINDVSFIIEDKLVVLIEQQASINENMPLRFLFYVSRLYENYIASSNINIYKRNLIKLPAPEFICLYNGADDIPDEQESSLRDAFKITMPEGKESFSLDLKVKILNINKGRNNDILTKSKPLNDYAIFVDNVRECVKSRDMSLEEAIRTTIEYCINNDILTDYLMQYSAEVVNMLTTEFDYERAMEAAIEDGIERGIEKGIEKGKQEAIILFVKKLRAKGMSNEEISDIAEISIEDVQEIK